MQLKAPPVSIFGDLETMRNELVIKMQPGEGLLFQGKGQHYDERVFRVCQG